MQEAVGSGSNFRLLAETPGSEFVAGAIGKICRPGICFVDIGPEVFTQFGEPRYAKVAFSFEVHPRPSGGSWIGVDLRATTTDEASWRELLPWWMTMGRAAHLLRRRLLLKLGWELERAPSDAERELPGDDLVASVGGFTTATIIEAPLATVWRSLLRMPTRHLGWQHIRSEPQRLLVLGTRGRRASYECTSAFVLEPIGEGATHLVARVRAVSAPSPGSELAVPLLASPPALGELTKLWCLMRRVEAIALPNRAPALGPASLAAHRLDDPSQADRAGEDSVGAEMIDEVLGFGT
jgi:hypothetical protein